MTKFQWSIIEKKYKCDKSFVKNVDLKNNEKSKHVNGIKIKDNKEKERTTDSKAVNTECDNSD